MRREQSAGRSQAQAEEWDPEYGLYKVSPLIDWSEAQVWQYIRARELPYNPLHDRHYPSIGCSPCTRATQPGESRRAGRWWWEQPESRECGLHQDIWRGARRPDALGPRMDYLPIFLRVEARPVVVVGGGEVALRKAQWLLKAGAQVTVVAPALHAQLARYAVNAEPTAPRRRVLPRYIPATSAVAVAGRPPASAAVNTASRLARPRTCAAHPGERRRRCAALHLHLPGDHRPLPAHSRGELRRPRPGPRPPGARTDRGAAARAPGCAGALHGPAPQARAGDAAERRTARVLGAHRGRPGQPREVLRGRNEEAAAAPGLRRELRTSQLTTAGGRAGLPSLGEVYLIGAGPGDPDLLTLRAQQLLQQADVVLYDRLVSEAVLERARRDAQRIFVGKEAGERGQQERIHALLVELTSRGQRVARLKGGDPFVFGRGGEEIEVLQRHGIPYTVVPGITAALGAAAAAGLPLTHRRLAHSVTFVTAQLAEGAPPDWRYFANPRHTVVFYMGVAQLPPPSSARLRASAGCQPPPTRWRSSSVPRSPGSACCAARSPISARSRRRRAARAPPALLIVGAGGQRSLAAEALTRARKPRGAAPVALA